MANQTAALRTLSRPLLPVGDLFAFAVDVLRAVFVRPFQWREFFDQAWFVTRVVVLGAESTGTTTLCQDLSVHYGCPWVPEYGRTYCERRPGPIRWRPADFIHIAAGQLTDEDAAARTSGPLLICDTDALATSVWHERYLGHRSAAVERLAADRRYALHILTADDIPFVQDGTRDGEHIRGWDGLVTHHDGETVDHAVVETRVRSSEATHGINLFVRQKSVGDVRLHLSEDVAGVLGHAQTVGGLADGERFIYGHLVAETSGLCAFGATDVDQMLDDGHDAVEVSVWWKIDHTGVVELG